MKRKRGVKTKKRIIGIFVGLLLIISFLIARFNFTLAAPLAELDPDDWDLELVFFDSTVNKGKDPITNINWTIGGDDLAFSASESRTITLQVNYKNANVNRTYEPGELQIKVPNPYSSTQRNSNHGQLDLQLAVGANDSSQASYDWDYNYNSYNSNGWIFTNRKPIEESSNVEGSIQVVYYLTSKSETRERYEDSCVHTTDTTDIKAVMNDVVESNLAETHYSRTYSHPWKRATYDITKTATKIPSLDNLGDNASDYIWVRYRISGKSSEPANMSYSTADYNNYIGLSSYRMLDKFPADVKIQNASGEALERDENGYVDVKNSNSYSCTSYYVCREVYVGYPKSIYNQEAGNLNITNTAELRGVYSDRTDEEELATSTITLNLSDFEFTYPAGDQVGLSKTYCGNRVSSTACHSLPYYYQDIIRNGSTARFRNTVTARYLGNAFDIEVGDDLLYYVNDSGELARMNENDYYFASVTLPTLKNANDISIPNTKYEAKIFYRYRGETSYTDGGTVSLGSTVTLGTEHPVSAWYIRIEGLTESIMSAYFYTNVVLKSNNLSRTGTLYNFDYVKYIINGEVQNYWSIDNYTNDLTKAVIAPYDMENYGHYLHRSWASGNWEYHDIGDINHRHSMYKRTHVTNPTFDPSDESFKDYYYIYAQVYDYNTKAFADMELNREQMEEKDWRHNFNYYDLLPLGMELDGTKEDIINSAGVDICAVALYGKDGNKLFEDKNECMEFNKNHTTVTITKNWRNTGRTHVGIHLDYSSKPFTVLNGACNSTSCYNANLASFRIPYRVSYDSYIENGRTYQNYVAGDSSDYEYKSTKDTGASSCGGEESADINNNGSTDDYVACTYAAVNLLSATSTRQDLQTSVLTEHSGKYETDLAQSGFGENYSYKLRVRTGSSKVTNMIIYSHIEESYGDNMHWKGSFDGIDTSYAETRLDYYDNPIQIKAYWSPKVDAGPLASDNSWQEYNEATVDKSKVRSVAFQYLDQNGQPAIMTQQFYSYVIVKMKAPSDENVHVLAYNNSHSEWNAIDNLTGQLIYDITGIDSNIVTVFLSEKYDITVKKLWSDYNNYYAIRPTKITFNLYKDTAIIDSKELNIAGGETEVKFEGLDTVDQSHYRVEEEAVAEYTTSYTQDEQSLDYTFTNTIVRSKPVFSLSAKKVWSDYNNYYAVRPTKIKFNLYKDDVVVTSKELNVAGGETEVKFEGLNALEQDGYRIEEEAVSEYTSRFSYDETSHTYTFTNTLNRSEPRFSIEVRKLWSDYGDYYKLRPEKIKFNLIKGDDVVDSKELDIASGESEAEFEDLNALEHDSYRVEEEAVAEYTSSYTKESDSDVYIFTNTINRDEPKPEEMPENAKTNDNGVKVFFIINGAILGLLTVVGATIVRTSRRS